MLVHFRRCRRGLATARGAPAFLSYKPGDLALRDGHLSPFNSPDRPGKRAQRRRADCLRHALQIDK